MALITEYNRKNGLDHLVTQYDLKACYHPSLPLVILNYNRTANKNSPYTNTCRGLILELDTWNPIAQGMTRFFDIKPDEIVPTSAEIKEDGTLIHMFNYQGSWLLATRHNFADDYVNDRTLTYQQLFEKISERPVGELGLSLNPKVTYCLEMCSKDNRIIRKYQPGVIYLLTCYQQGIELSEKEVDTEAAKIGWKRPNRYLVNTLEQCQLLLAEESLKDPLFEGLVIKDKEGRRYKKKNRFYLDIHKLKYRGWKVALPKLVVPLLLHHSDKLDLIYEAISSGHDINIDVDLNIIRQYWTQNIQR